MAIVVIYVLIGDDCRNYPATDKDGLIVLIPGSVPAKSLMLLDVILDESKRTSKELQLKRCLSSKTRISHSDKGSFHMPQRFSNMIDNNFCVD